MKVASTALTLAILSHSSSLALGRSEGAVSTADVQAAVDVSSTKTEPDVANIIDGVPTGKPLPYQVRLKFYDFDGFSSKCGGSLISSRFVLTAAHCYTDTGSVSKILVQVNLYDTNNPSGSGDIYLSSHKLGVDVFVHPDWDGSIGFENGRNDIALIKLPFGIEEDEVIQYVQLNEDPNVPVTINKPAGSTEYDEVYVSGWGLTEKDGANASNVLRATILAPADCTVGGVPTPNDQICALPFSENEAPGVACQGDSGGPMVLAAAGRDVSDWDDLRYADPPTQVGIVSWGNNCGGLNMYTRVSSYIDWIHETACDASGQFCSGGGGGYGGGKSKSGKGASMSYTGKSGKGGYSYFSKSNKRG